MHDKDTISFSNVTFFDKNFAINLNNVADKESFEKILDDQVDNYVRNSFYMIKLDGTIVGLNLSSNEASFDKTDAFNMNVPMKNNFHELNFNQDLKEDIRIDEKTASRKINI